MVIISDTFSSFFHFIICALSFLRTLLFPFGRQLSFRALDDDSREAEGDVEAAQRRTLEEEVRSFKKKTVNASLPLCSPSLLSVCLCVRVRPHALSHSSCAHSIPLVCSHSPTLSLFLSPYPLLKIIFPLRSQGGPIERAVQ